MDVTGEAYSAEVKTDLDTTSTHPPSLKQMINKALKIKFSDGEEPLLDAIASGGDKKWEPEMTRD